MSQFWLMEGRGNAELKVGKNGSRAKAPEKRQMKKKEWEVGSSEGGEGDEKEKTWQKQNILHSGLEK